MLLLRQVFHGTYRQIFGENRHSRISSRALAKVPISMIARNSDRILLERVVVDLRLIETKDIGFHLLHIVLEVLPVEHGSNSIHVPWTYQQFIRSLAVSVLPEAGVVDILAFCVSRARAELFGSALDCLDCLWGGFLGNYLFGEQFGLFLNWLSLLGFFFNFLGSFFWRHNNFITRANVSYYQAD